MHIHDSCTEKVEITTHPWPSSKFQYATRSGSAGSTGLGGVVPAAPAEPRAYSAPTMPSTICGWGGSSGVSVVRADGLLDQQGPRKHKTAVMPQHPQHPAAPGLPTCFQLCADHRRQIGTYICILPLPSPATWSQCPPTCSWLRATRQRRISSTRPKKSCVYVRRSIYLVSGVHALNWMHDLNGRTT